MSQDFRGRVDVGRSLEPDVVFDADSPMETTVSIDGDAADIRVGGSGESGDIRLFSVDGLNPTIHIDGGEGDIKLMGADCAEEFEVASGHEASEPGSVMSVNRSGKLCLSARAYDTSVVGVVSGAGPYQPGIVLGSGGSDGPSLAIALLGKVLCRVDARSHPVAVGDMLTTSDLTGHTMKADDPTRSPGAIVGKALGSLAKGTGMIPMLVAIQ